MLAMLFVPVAALAGVSWWLMSRDAIRARHVLIAVVLAAWVAAVETKVYIDHAPDEPQNSASIASAFRLPEWAVSPSPEPTAPTVVDSAAERAVTAAPIADLIGGLEARLASHPDDAKGWALLAQSYAFVGDSVAAERALQRAVGLGADEQTLRERVQAARREPDAHSWIEQAIGG
jgi:cytochrome c-type biogenesis protein CcmH/NrfG